MKKIIVCQHVPFEILGTIDPLLRKSTCRIKYVNFARHPHFVPSIERYDGLVILGGPMNVDEADKLPFLNTEIKLIQEALARDIPILGICLGAQLIAAALGAKVKPQNKSEIGWYDINVTPEGNKDFLLQHMKTTEKIFHWHSYEADLPEGATLLASSDYCANQAFRYKNNVYGLQFHLEVDSQLVERWLSLPLYEDYLNHLDDNMTKESIRNDTKNNISRTEELSRLVFSNFIKLL